jgi:hypothetical protein
MCSAYYNINNIGQVFEYNERLGCQSKTGFIAHLDICLVAILEALLPPVPED